MAARLLVSLFVILASTPLSDSNPGFSGKVVGVADGDTITVLRDRTPVRIRLLGIDSPESGQAFGAKAKAFTSDLVFGQVVTIHTYNLDRYGRTVAEVVLPDGRLLNQELVRAGFAWWYSKYAPNDARLKELDSPFLEPPRRLASVEFSGRQITQGAMKTRLVVLPNDFGHQRFRLQQVRRLFLLQALPKGSVGSLHQTIFLRAMRPNPVMAQTVLLEHYAELFCDVAAAVVRADLRLRRRLSVESLGQGLDYLLGRETHR